MFVFDTKRKQLDYKPGSVYQQWDVDMSVIYPIHESPHVFSVLPSTELSGGLPWWR